MLVARVVFIMLDGWIRVDRGGVVVGHFMVYVSCCSACFVVVVLIWLRLGDWK